MALATGWIGGQLPLITNPTNYSLSAEGYLAEIDRMNLEVRDYLSAHPSEITHDRGVPLDSQ